MVEDMMEDENKIYNFHRGKMKKKMRKLYMDEE